MKWTLGLIGGICWAASMQPDQEPSSPSSGKGPFESTLPSDFNFASLSDKNPVPIKVNDEALSQRLRTLEKIGNREEFDKLLEKKLFKWGMDHAPAVGEIPTTIFFHETPFHVVNKVSLVKGYPGLQVDPRTRFLFKDGQPVVKDFVLIVATIADTDELKKELFAMDQEYRKSMEKHKEVAADLEGVAATKRANKGKRKHGIDGTEEPEEMIPLMDEDHEQEGTGEDEGDEKDDYDGMEVDEPSLVNPTPPSGLNVLAPRDPNADVDPILRAIANARTDQERIMAIESFANPQSLELFLVERSLLELYSEVLAAQLKFPGSHLNSVIFHPELCAQQWHTVLSYMVYARHTHDLADPPEFHDIPLGPLALLTVQASSILGVRDPEDITKYDL